MSDEQGGDRGGRQADEGGEDVALTSLRSVSRGASQFVVGKVILDALTFLLNLVLTRGLGSSLYGVYAYANTLVVLAIVFTNLGTDKALLKYVPQYEDDEPKRRLMVGLAYATSFVASFVVAAGLYLLAPLVTRYTLGDPLLVDVLRLFALLLVADTMVRVLTSTFRSLEVLEYRVLVDQIAKPTARLIAIAVALWLGLSFYGVMASLVVASLVVLAVAAGLFLSRIDLRPSLQPGALSRDDVAEYYNFSIPLVLKDAGAILRGRTDVLMVGIFLSSTSVGIYNVSLLIVGFLSLPHSGINQLFPPVASRLYSNGDLEELDDIFGTVTRWNVTVTVFLAALIATYRAEVLSLFGGEFTAGAAVLVIFVASKLFSNGTGPSGYLLMISEHQYVLLANQWVFGALNVGLNYVFIVEFGLIGAALASATINAANNVARLVQIWYYEGLFPYSASYAKPFVAGLGAMAVMYGTNLYANDFRVLLGAVGGLVTFLAILALLGVEQEDRDFVRDVVGS